MSNKSPVLQTIPSAVLAALGAALLFGASTPLAKPFTTQMSALLLAGLLYLGSGLGLSLLRLLRDRGWKRPGLRPSEWGWLLAAVACGGVVAPVLLMLGLTRSSAATTSLLLNLEGVLTALLAWLVFKENADRRVVLGMALIVLGGVVLSWPGESTVHTLDSITGPLLISLACLFWALDNNLTRRVANVDAVLLAAVKGLVAAGVNISLAMALGQTLPGWSVAGPVILIGFLGYGLSLVLFVLALRGLGSARTSAYFGAAPFMGAALALGVLGEASPSGFWIAGLLMTAGLWLHLTERHEHPHWHGDLLHSHAHYPDMEHRHEHP